MWIEIRMRASLDEFSLKHPSPSHLVLKTRRWWSWANCLCCVTFVPLAHVFRRTLFVAWGRRGRKDEARSSFVLPPRIVSLDLSYRHVSNQYLLLTHACEDPRIEISPLCEYPQINEVQVLTSSLVRAGPSLTGLIATEVQLALTLLHGQVSPCISMHLHAYACTLLILKKSIQQRRDVYLFSVSSI